MIAQAGRRAPPPRGLSLPFYRSDSTEEFGLVKRIFKGIVCPFELRVKRLGYVAGLGTCPRAIRCPHVERFNVQRGKSERVSGQVSVEIVVDKGPVKRGIEAYKDWIGFRASHFQYPVTEIPHCSFRLKACPIQLIQ